MGNRDSMTTADIAQIILRGLRYRFGKRILQGNYKNPFGTLAERPYMNNALREAMFDRYQKMLEDLPNSMQLRLENVNE